ncbi:hypothetical protein [Legionella brunensis]|uniref:Uncharacterized protein n=1 Tax=Legionella brunensis TaxID=29422 RepID=A0A0W0SDI7_9GAMM|nr:hypothetical protein [Legionella brunensis]KTC81548.1 hypothetical protein Lbru_2068 [Legionella brunensis]
MRTYIYQWSPKLLKTLQKDINDYCEMHPYSAIDSSFMDFHRENFIAEIHTESYSEKEIYKKLVDYTGDKSLTEAILSAGGGQSLLSIPYFILNDLTIAENHYLNQYYKTGSYRQLIYTKNGRDEYFANLYLCFYGLRNGKENILLDRQTTDLKSVDINAYQSVFTSGLHHQHEKATLEKVAAQKLHFDVAPFAAMYIRLKLNGQGSLTFIPVVAKIAINYTTFEPKNRDEMYRSKVLGCSADAAIYSEFTHNIADDLTDRHGYFSENEVVSELAKKLNYVFYSLRARHYNQFLCLLEDFYFHVKGYLAFDPVRKKIKAVTQDNIIEFVADCLKIVKPDLQDLVLICQLITAFYSSEISQFGKMKYSLGQIYYVLSHYISSHLDSNLIREETDEHRFSPELLGKILEVINSDYLVTEYRKMEAFYILKIKAYEILYSYNIPTLAFENEFDEVEEAFYSQIYSIFHLNYSPHLTNQEYRLLLLERLYSLSDAINKVEQANEPNIERKNFIINKASELLGLVQSFSYLIHNPALAGKMLTEPFEQVFDSTILGKRNPDLEDGLFLDHLFTESDMDDYHFPEKVNRIWVAYLTSIKNLFASVPHDLISDKGWSALTEQLQEAREKLRAYPKNLSANSLLVANFRNSLENFWDAKQPGFTSYMKTDTSEWLKKLHKLIDIEDNVYLLQLLCKFYVGEYYLPDLQACLTQYLMTTQTNWAGWKFFKSVTPYQICCEIFFQNLMNQAAEDHLLCIQYDILDTLPEVKNISKEADTITPN